MTNPAAALDPAIEPYKRLIVALDVPTAAEALSVVNELRGQVGAFKVGLQLFTAAGPEFVKKLTSSGVNIFLDLKFHDIPNTVASAAAEAARLGVWMFNVHATGGSKMMAQAKRSLDEVCERESIERPLLIAVTVLTSSDDSGLREIGINQSVDEQVRTLAKIAAAAGLDGVVASAREVPLIRKTSGTETLITVTPGIRATTATNDDQKRVMTFSEAIAAGSDYIVAGRPVIQARDRSAAVAELLAS